MFARGKGKRGKGGAIPPPVTQEDVVKPTPAEVHPPVNESSLQNPEGGGEGIEVKILALEIHNYFRQIHASPPLALDSTMCEQAQAYAKCVVDGMNPGTPENSTLGVNVHQIDTASNCLKVYSDEDAVREAITNWWSYYKQYNWRAPITSPRVTKRFCQVVWKSTEKLGIGLASKTDEQDGRKLIVVVAVYSPSQNLTFGKGHLENVFKPDI